MITVRNLSIGKKKQYTKAEDKHEKISQELHIRSTQAKQHF